MVLEKWNHWEIKGKCFYLESNVISRWFNNLTVKNKITHGKEYTSEPLYGRNAWSRNRPGLEGTQSIAESVSPHSVSWGMYPRETQTPTFIGLLSLCSPAPSGKNLPSLSLYISEFRDRRFILSVPSLQTLSVLK